MHRKINQFHQDPDLGFEEAVVPHFEGSTHGVFHPNNGFALNGVELEFQSNFQSPFLLNIHLHANDLGFALEEAYLESSLLFPSLKAHIGKIQSQFGLMNGRHKHAWAFVDAPLSQALFFGEEGLREKGLRLQWNSEGLGQILGIELLEGVNPNSFGTQRFESEGKKRDQVSQPNVVVAWWDFKSSSFHGGASLAGGRSHLISTTHLDVNASSSDSLVTAREKLIAHSAQSFDAVRQDESSSRIVADTRLVGVEWEWFGEAPFSWQSWLLRGELMVRRMEGSLYDGASKKRLKREQQIGYAEGMVHFSSSWLLGLCWEQLMKNEQTLGSADMEQSNQVKQSPSYRWAMMLSHQLDRHTALKMQWNQDHSKYRNEDELVIHEWIVQLSRSFDFQWEHLSQNDH